MFSSLPTASPFDNEFLAALPDAELQRLIPHLKPVTLHRGQVLHEEGEAPQRVYFLTEGIASLTVSTDEGKELQLSLVGNEGIVGVRAIFEGGLTLIRCSMLTDGCGYDMPPAIFNEEFKRNGELHNLVMRALEARLAETSQTALCGQMHSVEQRLSRWLLTLADRIHTEELSVTQELMAQMLGVRRAGVTLAAGVLRDAGLIEYSRGHISIVDRKGLEERTCECYQATKEAVEKAYHPEHPNDPAS